MALADRGWRLGLFLPLPYTLSVTARLLATALLALVAGPIPLGRQPPRPKPRRLGRRLCYSTAREDEGEKTTSRTPSRDKSAHEQWAGTCGCGEEQSCWTRDQGSANSRRSSPGSGASTPLRDAFDSSPPARLPSIQLNHSAPALPPVSAAACHLAPISPRFIRARPGPLIPRNWPPNNRAPIGGQGGNIVKDAANPKEISPLVVPGPVAGYPRNVSPLQSLFGWHFFDGSRRRFRHHDAWLGIVSDRFRECLGAEPPSA